jgi:hypothetical protein
MPTIGRLVESDTGCSFPEEPMNRLTHELDILPENRRCCNKLIMKKNVLVSYYGGKMRAGFAEWVRRAASAGPSHEPGPGCRLRMKSGAPAAVSGLDPA